MNVPLNVFRVSWKVRRRLSEPIAFTTATRGIHTLAQCQTSLPKEKKSVRNLMKAKPSL